MKRIIAIIAAAAMLVPQLTFAASAETEKTGGRLDTVILGNDSSEAEHSVTAERSASGEDNEASYQSKDDEGVYFGGGLGDGLSYRYILPPASKEDESEGYIRFTVKADPAATNYVTLRLSGNQYDRGNIMLLAGDGSRDHLDPRNAREYAELDCGQYTEAPPFPGRYYYVSYKIPQQLVKPDGTADLRLIAIGKMDSYGTSDYTDITQPSKYIYSIETSTEPYYETADSFRGEAPKAKAVEKTGGGSAYDYLKSETEAMTERMMSWQCFGEEWDKAKNDNALFMDGAVIRNKPVTEADFSGTSDEIARRYTQEAIMHQNWSTMSNLMVLSNAYCFDFSKYKNDSEILERYFRLMDFYVRAQDSEGGWCYHTSGEDKNAWLGADLKGSGVRGTGEWWPLMSLGADAMLQSFVQLNDYAVSTGGDVKNTYDAFLEERIDGDLTGRRDRTRREFYIDMFAMLRDRLANPKRGVGDFYAPTNRAGTANQDFGFAYYANNIVELLEDGAKSELDTEHTRDDDLKYLDMVRYKYGEMVDGEKWFSTANGTGLEGGASHGGWAGDYGTLLISVTERYAESARYLPEDAKKVFADQAYKAFESAKYFYYPALDADGCEVLSSEVYASSRKDGYGVHKAYPVAGYTATRLGSEGALSMLAKYIEHDRGYTGDIRSLFDKKSPHIYTNLVDSQDILKYYSEVERLIKDGKVGPLPMEDSHPDFAWFDTDAQAVVFKNNGDRCYITFNYRRDDWKYNDYTRVHMINDDIDRLAEVRSSHQGGVYQWTDDSHRTDAGNPYTHTRFDGMSEVRYGKYIAAINQSTNDPSVGQSGKTYTMEQTAGVTKARDLVSGRVYEDKNGISVNVPPQSGVVLEIIESLPTCRVGAVYKCGDFILGSRSCLAKAGDTVSFEAARFEGYSPVDGGARQVTATEGEDNNVVFEYEVNSVPVFTADKRSVEDAGWTLFNPQGVEGSIVTNAAGDMTAISSKGIVGEANLKKTFAYKELTGDFRLKFTLTGFDRTSSADDYFGAFITDRLDFEKANYVEYRHFSNNNNILMVDHTSSQEKSVTGHWAGDMNNKAVPIDAIIERKGNMIEYWYRTDSGEFLQTSKPRFEFNGDSALYVGLVMTAATGETNTAHVENVTIDAEMVGRAISVGEKTVIDFGAADAENDAVTFELSPLPEGAVLVGSVIEFVPVREGEYFFTATVNDAYHEQASEKTVKVNVSPVIRIRVNGEYLASDVSPYVTVSGRTMIPARAVSEALGASVDAAADMSSVTITKGGTAISFAVGSDEADVNGKAVRLDEAAVITDARLMIPLRFAAEQLGADISWIQDEYTVTIDK